MEPDYKTLLQVRGSTLAIDLLEHTAPIRSLMVDPRLPNRRELIGALRKRWDRLERAMVTRILLAAILCLMPAFAVAQTDTGPGRDIAAIHYLIEQYLKAVDT